MPSAPGFYGKAPALGDFVSRRLPASVAAAWDAWLQHLVRASQDSLGADWLPAWLEAPVWHFALGSGVLSPESWFGVLIPSVDRVGRYFPFSILATVQDGDAKLDGWGGQAEALALGALEDGFDPARLEAELAALGNPSAPDPLTPALSQGEREKGCPLSPWERAGVRGLPADDYSLWHCRGTARVPAGLRQCHGLPAGPEAAALVGAPQGSP